MHTCLHQNIGNVFHPENLHLYLRHVLYVVYK
jgi:hypothetical protein